MATFDTPTDDQLRNYLVGNLTLAEFDAVESGLDATPDLAERIAGTAKNLDDTLLSALRKRPTSLGDSVDDSGYQRGLELVRDIGREWSQTPESRVADEPTAVSALTQQFVDSQPVDRYRTGDDAPLTVLRDYRLLEKIGEGGMGAVYKALQTRLEKVVALKILPQDRLKDAATVARFEREMKAVGRLDHPNIVRATDAGEHDGQHFLVMEFVDGIDLAQYVQKQGPLSVSQAVHVIRQAAAGLQYAHDQGLIHRDIKPSNLMVENHKTDGENADAQLSVKILDLGLARLESETAIESQTEPEITTAGTVMGTVDYMSPEQALDTHNADARSDIYSLGCTLFYLLTGRTLYGGKTVMERLVAHREQPIPSLSDSPMEPIFGKMVAKNPADRFQSMAEVVAACDALQAAEKSSANAMPASVATRPPMSRRTKVAIWAASAAAMLAGIIWITTNKERWKIETRGEGVEVSTVDGTVTARDTQTGTTVKISPEGTNIATKGDRNKVKITDDGFELIRDGKIIATGKKESRAFMSRATPKAMDMTSEYALLFDGSDDYISVPTLRGAPNGPMTIEAWVTPDPKCPQLGTVYESHGFKLRVFMAGPQWMFIAYGNREQSALIATPFRVPAGQRIHVAGVYGEGTIRLYLNGTIIDGQKIPDGFEFSDDKVKKSAIIGSSLAKDADGMFRGLIHGIRISSIDRYKRNFRPADRLANDDNTLALYLFNGPGGTQLVDSSGNKHHGQIHGAKWLKKISDTTFRAPDRPPVEAVKPRRQP